MIKKYFYILLFALCFSGNYMYAQGSGWTVDASNYQYSMTFTAFLNVNGTTLSSSEDEVAAFVNDEIRGVAKLSYVASYNKYVAYLTVYANTNSETISFKIYNSSTASIVDVASTYQFSISENVGGVLQSYSIASPTLNNETLLNSFSFKGITDSKQSVSANTIDITVPKDTDITNLIPVFTTSKGAKVYVDKKLQISNVTSQDFKNTITYQVVSENEAFANDYQIRVSVEEVAISAPVIQLKTSVGSFVNKAPVLVDLETNVALTGLDKNAITITNAVVSSIIKENDVLYKLQIVPIQQGLFTVEILGNKVFNLQNDANAASNKLSFTYDLVPPYVTTIKRKSPIDELTKSDALEFTVTFSEAVENVKATDFSTVSNAILSIVQETAATYTVTVKNIEYFIGVVPLTIKSSNTIQDKAGNLLLNSIFNPYQN